MTDAEPALAPSRLRRLFPVVVLLVASFTVYRPALDAPFLWDDEVDIVGNPRTLSLWPLSRVLGGNARPVGQLSFALDRAISGERPVGWHLTNVLVHMAAGLALYALLKRTLRRPVLGEPIREAGEVAAFVTALVWVLHPLHTSAVSLVVHRYESLMGLFFFAALAALAVAAESPRPAVWLTLSAAGCLLGMGTKEPMVAFPLVALAWDRTFWAGSARGALARRWGYYLVLASGWGLVAALRAMSPRIGSVGLGFEGLGPLDYLRSQAGVILHYLRLALFPRGLTVDYYDWPVARSAGDWLPQGLVVVALVGLGGWALARRRPEGVAAAAFFLVLAPTSTVLPLFGELAAERRMYVPLAALLAVLVPALLVATRRLPETAVGVGFLGVALALGGSTFVRNRVFESEVSLWRDAVAKRPANPRAHNNLGTAYDAAGDPEEGERHWREALRLDPRNLEARGNLASRLFEAGRFEEAEAELRTVVATESGRASAWHNLGLAAERLGRPAEAENAYRKALALEPENPGYGNDLAWLLATTDDAGLRRPEEAVRIARRALELSFRPRPEILDTLAAALAAAGRFPEAVGTAEKALALARNEGSSELAVEIGARLEGYRAGRLAGGSPPSLPNRPR